MRKLWVSNGHCYFECPDCQFVRVSPVPQSEVLRDYYDKSYEVDRERYQRNVESLGCRDLEFLERLEGKGRMLEVGCSWGFFLEAAHRRGWRVQGIEVSDSAAKWAKKNFGLDIICGTIEDFMSLGVTSFDVVVSWHVIEHVQDPISFLKIVRECLRPGGIVMLRTPNICSASARLNSWAWHWVGAPAHLSLFSPKSLKVAVELAGFSILHVVTRRGDAYNPLFEALRASALRAGVHQKIKRLFKLTDKSATNGPAVGGSLPGRRSEILRKLSSIFDTIFIVFLPFEKLLDFAGWGPELLLAAQRKD